MAKRKKSLSWQAQIILTIGAICAIIFMPTTTVLGLGMLPTLVALYIDRSPERVRGITIGALNMAGCTMFIMDLWLTGHTMENAIYILSNPVAWIVMYASAGVGYCLEWVIIGAVSVYVEERAKMRVKDLQHQQEELVERWGREVTGTIPLDEEGYPMQSTTEIS